jgi:hypothetical protein
LNNEIDPIGRLELGAVVHDGKPNLVPEADAVFCQLRDSSVQAQLLRSVSSVSSVVASVMQQELVR